jgi:large subunit ribosomal protein L13Ae
MFWRIIRGMTPHKTARGAAALQRLKVFDGCPYPYADKKRMVVPSALKVLRIKSHRNTCEVGELMNMCGWRRKDIVEKLEEKRKVKSQAYFEKRQKKLAIKKKQMGDAKLN